MSPFCFTIFGIFRIIYKRIKIGKVIQMAKHEFGIMHIAPKFGERYDTYEPQKYDCIFVEDDDILPILEQLQEIDFYWHTLDVSGKGLAYYGVTLISPEASKAFLSKIENMVSLLA